MASSLAELMYGEYGGDMEDYWRGAWEAASGLPAGVSATGSLREVGGHAHGRDRLAANQKAEPHST